MLLRDVSEWVKQVYTLVTGYRKETQILIH